MTQTEFARALGVNKSYVTRLKQAGRLVLDDSGMVAVAESKRRIRETESPHRDDVRARHAAARGGAAADAGDKVGATFQQARAVKERYLALQAKADYERGIGKLVETDAVRHAGADLGAHLRTTLENLPHQLAPELAAIADPARIQALLAERMELVLNEIAERIAERVRKMGAHTERGVKP